MLNKNVEKLIETNDYIEAHGWIVWGPHPGKKLEAVADHGMWCPQLDYGLGIKFNEIVLSHHCVLSESTNLQL